MYYMISLQQVYVYYFIPGCADCGRILCEQCRYAPHGCEKLEKEKELNKKKTPEEIREEMAAKAAKELAREEALRDEYETGDSYFCVKKQSLLGLSSIIIRVLRGPRPAPIIIHDFNECSMFNHVVY